MPLQNGRATKAVSKYQDESDSDWGNLSFLEWIRVHSKKNHFIWCTKLDMYINIFFKRKLHFDWMYCTFTESWGRSNFVQCSCFQSCKRLRVPILFNIFTFHHVTSFSIKPAVNWGNYWIFIYLYFCRLKSLFFFFSLNHCCPQYLHCLLFIFILPY